MILLNGIPNYLVFGNVGITATQIVDIGGEDSPLLNDIDGGDSTTEFIWVLLPPLPATGTTEADDFGYYALIDPTPGTWTQNYGILALSEI